MISLILNGMKAQLPAVRDAVNARRKSGDVFEVLVTWEPGDAARMAEQAGQAGVKRLIAGGGDGTVNEVVKGLMRLPRERRPELGILPLGSANDLATSVGLPLDAEPALEAALRLEAFPVDVPRLGDHHYLNMASGGFGPEITSSTPKTLKRLLGGGAYSLIGALRAWQYKLYPGQLEWEGGKRSASLFLLAIGNGVQAGGGQPLTPEAKLDDGLLDVLVIRDFTGLSQMRKVIAELQSRPKQGEFVDAFRTPWLTFEGDVELPITLDGEPCQRRGFRVELDPGALSLAVPLDCALLSCERPGVTAQLASRQQSRHHGV
ncbi:lipid kinase YegS [Halomonas korlensis]|uniref:Lipid kinase YegS n=1 Tax=Halomonas korlensis TaxID=463301 RepID=A0A1I7HT80_9GAMM|nr:lipid kinase YegS [Halomonas korlensis]SFU63841.1 lipid kinase YegS [Halomonas korlensis]